MTAMALDVRELTFEEMDWVSGGDRGDATVGAAIAGGGAGWATVRGASWGARLGGFAGPVGLIGGAILGGFAGYIVYEIGMGSYGC